LIRKLRLVTAVFLTIRNSIIQRDPRQQISIYEVKKERRKKHRPTNVAAKITNKRPYAMGRVIALHPNPIASNYDSRPL